MLLIAYDGSADSQAAIDHVAKLNPGARVTVLTVWVPYVEALTHAGMGLSWMPYADERGEIDKAAEDAARAQAEEGAARARAAGLDAEAMTRPRSATMHETILGAAADPVNADAIVVGSRGLTGLRSMLLGSVSNAVAHHADRPVVIVPSPTVAEERREMSRRHAAEPSS